MKLYDLKLLAIAGTLALSAGMAQAADRFTIATNPQGSLYYTIGGGMAAALQEALGKKVTVQPFAGSTVYLPMVAAGEATVGINSSLDTGAVYRGDYGSAAQGDLRMLARLWPLRVALASRANDGMTEVSDLKGKRVVTEFAALKAVSVVSRTILQAGGIQVDDVTPVTVSGLKAGMDGLTEGNLDAAAIAVGISLTQQAHASIPGGIRYLSITGDNATNEFVDDLYPGAYLLNVDPSPRMPEVTESFTAIGYDVFLTVSANLSDEEATEILSALFEAFPQLKKDYAPIRGGSQKAFATPSNTVPFHPAAVAFFKEQGLWTDANDARDASVAK